MMFELREILSHSPASKNGRPPHTKSNTLLNPKALARKTVSATGSVMALLLASDVGRGVFCVGCANTMAPADADAESRWE